jgi:hypothetical protein
LNKKKKKTVSNLNEISPVLVKGFDFFDVT